MIIMQVNGVSCFLFFLFCVQIDAAERKEKALELKDAGFNLSLDKVLNTDYFKVNR